MRIILDDSFKNARIAGKTAYEIMKGSELNYSDVKQYDIYNTLSIIGIKGNWWNKLIYEGNNILLLNNYNNEEFEDIFHNAIVNDLISNKEYEFKEIAPYALCFTCNNIETGTEIDFVKYGIVHDTIRLIRYPKDAIFTIPIRFYDRTFKMIFRVPPQDEVEIAMFYIARV